MGEEEGGGGEGVGRVCFEEGLGVGCMGLFSVSLSVLYIALEVWMERLVVGLGIFSEACLYRWGGVLYSSSPVVVTDSK